VIFKNTSKSVTLREGIVKREDGKDCRSREGEIGRERRQTKFFEKTPSTV